MGIKSALVQNFYMDFNEVIDTGERIRSVMATVDGCMEEADGLFCRISALAGNVPVKARCGALIFACENARAGIKKADFLEYGNRVSQNMFELADYSEYVSNEMIKKMEDIRERLRGIQNTVAGLNDLLEFRVYKSNPDRIRANMKRIVQKNSTIGEKNGQNKTFQELGEIYGQEYEKEAEYELTTSYLAARLAKIGVYGNGQPSINSGTEYLAYAECYRKIESGEYNNSYIAAKLAGLSVSEKGEPSINSATESDRYFYYFNRLPFRIRIISYSDTVVSYVKLKEGLELNLYNDGETIGYGFDINKHPDVEINYCSDGSITEEEAERLLKIVLDEDASYLNDFLNNRKLNIDQNVYDACIDLFYNRGCNDMTKEVVVAMAEKNDDKVQELLKNFDYYYALNYIYKNDEEESRAYVERNPGLEVRREEEYLIYKNGFNGEGGMIVD